MSNVNHEQNSRPSGLEFSTWRKPDQIKFDRLTIVAAEIYRVSMLAAVKVLDAWERIGKTVSRQKQNKKGLR